MSCAQIALKELGVIPKKYYASEIDKFAIRQTQLNFPDTIQLGSMEDWWLWDIDFSKIDLICAGTPCQGFSFAGKGLAFDDPRSKLFFTFIDIVNSVKEYNPDVKFLLENVNMKKEYRQVITEYCGAEPININSNLVSAQNRNRWYWTNIKGVTQPEDEGIYLKDILEEDVDEKYYVSQAVIDRMTRKTYSKPGINPDKARCLSTGNNSAKMSLDSGTTFVVHDNGRLRETNKANCIDANYWKGLDNHGQRTGILQRPRGNNKGGVFEGKTPTLSAKALEQNNLLLQDRIRRLTPLECSRLQTIPDWYRFEYKDKKGRTRRTSDTQIYRMLGNGWTVKVISHILKNI